MEYNHDIKKLSGFLVKLKNLEKFSSWTTEHQRVESDNQNNNQNSIIPTEEESQQKMLQKCLEENEQCHLLLSLLESYLNFLLEDCLKQQRILKANIDAHLKKQFKDSFGRKMCYIRKVSCMPYFKDANGFSHCHNEDVLKRQVHSYLNQYDVSVPRPWNEYDKSIVANYIKKVEKEKWTQTLVACGMLHMKNVGQMSLPELIEQRYDEYDWLKISVTALKSTHTSLECRAMWFNCLHPQINQKIWSEQEQEKLKILVKQCKFQDWERIAKELGTRRSGFQCVRKFNMQLREKNKHEWQEDEIVLLQKYVKMFCCGDFIPWNKLKRYIDGHDLNEIFKIWNSLNKGKEGTFSMEEDIVLVTGMKLFGSDYSHIKEYIPDRSARQVRKRVEVLKRRQFPMHAWSTQEDELLKILVNKYGFGNWLKISMHFVNRSPSAVRCRYTTLQKCKSHESCTSLTVRNPVRSTDPVNINVLWESAQNICQENEIENINNSKTPTAHSICKLSKILKLETHHSRKVENHKLKAITDKQYLKFFEGAHHLIESQSFKKNRRLVRKTNIRPLVYDTIMTLKVIEAKIDLPNIEVLDEDKIIPEHDRCVVKYLHDIMSKNNVHCEIFPSFNVPKFGLVRNEEKYIKSDECLLSFPPNFSTLIALHSLILNKDNIDELGQGLTMQVDNIELKQVNSICSTKSLHYSKNHITASKLWNERLQKLLGGISMVLNRELTALNF